MQLRKRVIAEIALYYRLEVWMVGLARAVSARISGKVVLNLLS